MEQKVFIVTEGEYSDYNICAVFGSKEEAETYCAAHTRDDFYTYRVEEYELGKIDEAKVLYEFEVNNYSMYWEAKLRYVFREKERPRDDRMRYVTLMENNPQKAIKIVQDRIAEEKARRAGI